MRGTDESPPPTSTAKPSRPSWTTPTSEMQLISGALQRSGQLAIEYLCLRGRFAHVGVAVELGGRRVDDRRRVEELVGGEP